MSGLGWIDFSAEHRSRVNAVLDLLRTPGVIDELGIGAVRDAFSDTLFPGLSTIQTRAKYFILVPRILKDYEQIPLSKRRESAAEYLRRRELECIGQLMKASDEKERFGIIGMSLEGTSYELKRKPSEIYWSGLRRFGFIKQLGGQRDVLSGLTRYEAPRQQRDRLGATEDDLPAESVEHPKINVPYEPGWYEDLHIELTGPEADLLRDRFRMEAQDSLMAWVLNEHSRADEFAALNASDFSELLGTSFFADLPAELKETVVAADDFWTLMDGAHILYNVLLQRRYNDGDPVREEEWEAWLEAIQGNAVLHARWRPELMWKLCQATGHRVNPRTVTFITEWIEAVKRQAVEDTLAGLVVRQEHRTKGARARLRVGGARVGADRYGLQKLLYRLPQARTMVRDIRNAQGRVVADA